MSSAELQRLTSAYRRGFYDAIARRPINTNRFNPVQRKDYLKGYAEGRKNLT